MWKRKRVGGLTLLQRLKPETEGVAQGAKFDAEATFAATLEPPQALAHEHRGAAEIAALQMQLRHRSLRINEHLDR